MFPNQTVKYFSKIFICFANAESTKCHYIILLNFSRKLYNFFYYLNFLFEF